MRPNQLVTMAGIRTGFGATLDYVMRPLCGPSLLVPRKAPDENPVQVVTNPRISAIVTVASTKVPRLFSIPD